MSFSLPANPETTHRALLGLSATVHEVLPDGQCSGQVVHKEGPVLLFVEGATRDECVARLKAALQVLRKECK